jgi:hypothetical protein
MDSTLRGCDVVSSKNKTGLPVRFEFTEQTRQAIDEHPAASPKGSGDFCSIAAAARVVASPRANMPVCCWNGSPASVSTVLVRHPFAAANQCHPDLPTTGNLPAVQLLLGHTKVERTVTHLGIEVDDALAIAEHIDV